MTKLSRPLIKAIKKNKTANFLELDGIADDVNRQELASLLVDALHKTSSLEVLSLANMAVKDIAFFEFVLKSPLTQLKSVTFYRFEKAAALAISKGLRDFSLAIKRLNLVSLTDDVCKIFYDALIPIANRYIIHFHGLGQHWSEKFTLLNNFSLAANMILQVEAVPLALMPEKKVNEAMSFLDQLDPFVKRLAVLEQQFSHQQKLLEKLIFENNALKQQYKSLPPSYASVHSQSATAIRHPFLPLPIGNRLPLRR